MNSTRHEKILLQKKIILEATERLLLENNQDIVIDALAKELDIAKGTIYKYFKSKNQLYLELIILNENRLLDISQNDKNDVKERVIRVLVLF